MTYIKKLVMKGFKSFPSRTEIPFDTGINVILGPNGSGKSNISDALCFVLGRLSIKSMRAAKASNLIFLGNKQVGPAKEAIVEITFDNENRIFPLDMPEVLIKRIVRSNGQSIYKINGETKTRQEVLELLSQAGIDPYGFNIILQGEIQSFVKMHSEDRRKIIEEVSGISVYESRKEKTLSELEKTEEKLKEVQAILRERTSYLNNLEKERQQALRFQELQQTAKRCKASIIHHDLSIKKKEADKINEEIDNKGKDLAKLKKTGEDIQQSISLVESKINQINILIQQATGFEQEKLNREIADLRADLAGLHVRSENFEKRLKETIMKRDELQESTEESGKELQELKKKTPTVKKTQEDLEKRKKEFSQLEENRKKFYTMRSELKSTRERVQDKLSFVRSLDSESDLLLRQIDTIHSSLYRKDVQDIPKVLEKLKIDLKEKQSFTEKIDLEERELEKNLSTSEFEINRLNKTKQDIEKLDICPLCKNKITKEHIKNIDKEMAPQLSILEKITTESKRKISDIIAKREKLKNEIATLQESISHAEADSVKFLSMEERKNQIKTIHEKSETAKKEYSDLEKRREFLEREVEKFAGVEEKYETARIEINELLLRSEENLDSEIAFKQRELERVKITVKQLFRDEEEIDENLDSIEKDIEEKQELLEKKEKQEEELSRRFKKLFEERDSLQEKIRERETVSLQNQHAARNLESNTNELKIQKAKIDAEAENFEIEFNEFPNIELIKSSKESLLERLQHTQEILNKIGSVNLRSLEVYDSIKKEYDSIQEKVQILEKEKEKILSIIHEIDIKKKKTFIKTLEAVNNLFSANFARLSTKGEVFLDVENKQSPFEGGVNIVVKIGKGKYFDVTSLSGGEQTLVALSLIFAIQEYKPYNFYILDEIDAALDKRNSERLAELLKKYMQSGQYIVITHNDEVISRATNIYGVSMHEGISKIVSMKL